MIRRVVCCSMWSDRTTWPRPNRTPLVFDSPHRIDSPIESIIPSSIWPYLNPIDYKVWGSLQARCIRSAYSTSMGWNSVWLRHMGRTSGRPSLMRPLMSRGSDIHVQKHNHFELSREPNVNLDDMLCCKAWLNVLNFFKWILQMLRLSQNRQAGSECRQ